MKTCDKIWNESNQEIFNTLVIKHYNECCTTL